MADTFVVDPYGAVGTMDPANVAEATSTGGYRLAKPEEIQDAQNKIKFGTGAGSAATAAGLGAARSFSLGLSDQYLTKSGAMTPEDLAAYKKYRPGWTATGEAAGIAGSLLAPEEGIGQILGGAPGLISKVGSSAVREIAPVAKGVADVLAEPASSPAMNKILSQSIAHGAGSAVEGAVYGLGNSISEDALGDPDALGEKLLQNVGLGAAIGGGLGTVFGGAKGLVQGLANKTLAPVEKAAIDAGEPEAMINAINISDKEKKDFVAGLNELKPNAKEITDATQRVTGDTPTPGQISASSAVQRGESLLQNGAPTYSGLRMSQKIFRGFSRAAQVVQDALGAASDYTKNTLGDTLKGIVSDGIKTQLAPIEDLYNEIKKYHEVIPVSNAATGSIKANIMRLDELRISPSSAEGKLAARVANEIGNLKTVDDVKIYKSILNRSTAPEERHMVAILAEKLSNLEDNSIVRFAQKEMKTSVAKDKIMQLLDQREAANAQYSVFRDKMERVGAALGRKKIYGAGDLLGYLENKLTNEQIAERLGGKNNAEFMDWFQKEFPQGSDAIKKYNKSQILEKANKGGHFSVNTALSEIDKLPKEFRESLFTPEELSKLEDVRTYTQSFPKNFNPSNTNNASAFRQFFEGPVSAAASNLRDLAIDKFIHAATDAGSDSTGQFVNALSTIERTANKSTASINAGANAIFHISKTQHAAVPITIQNKDEIYDRIHDALSDLGGNPSKLIDTLHTGAAPIAPFAPKTTMGFQKSTARAVNFLKSKLPGVNVPKMPLAPKYKASHSELSTFHRYYSVVKDPVSALKQVASGSLTPETMDALSTVYPQTLKEMQTAVMGAMTKKMNADIPYGKKMALSMFLGQDLMPSLSPVNILSNQNMLATATQAKNAQQAQMGRVNQTGMGKMDTSARLMTDQQASAQRGRA